jgi:cytochrome b subunit of formate dehydrogenase
MNNPSIRPHRGTMILVLGILGIVLCMICGIIAWVMGNADLREMQAGRMDRTGEGLTKAGKICGMIGTILWGLYLVFNIVVLVIALVAGGAAAASGMGNP